MILQKEALPQGFGILPIAWSLDCGRLLLQMADGRERVPLRGEEGAV